MNFNIFYSKKIYLALLATSLFTLSCSDDDDNNDNNEPVVMMIDPLDTTEEIWDYEDGPRGPEFWADLDPDFEACGRGVEQSPINLVSDTVSLQGATIGEGEDAITVPTGELVFNYSTAAVLDAFNNTRTNEFVVEEGSYVMFNGTQFNLAQFHGHAASEHTLGGEQSPLELHFVHVSDANELLVVGVLIEEGAENENYTSFWTEENFFTTQTEDVRERAAGTHDLTTLLPIGETLYQYGGSLTTPPCSEGVNWNVFTESIEMSADQLALFTDIFDNNYRPIQELNDRVVTESVETETVATDI